MQRHSIAGLFYAQSTQMLDAPMRFEEFKNENEQ